MQAQELLITFTFFFIMIIMRPLFSSEYPVILSIEDHCSLPQQRKMAEAFQVLRKKLFRLKIAPLRFQILSGLNRDPVQGVN